MYIKKSIFIKKNNPTSQIKSNQGHNVWKA